ncbi:helicase associated domain-containing protein, partial [Bacillus cereus]|nr:helicase associated domain-containing protein [Bacillus cereus]
KLNDLGFRWNPKKENWDGKYELLVEYKNANGDCLVNKHHPELGSWVIKQRALFKNGTLDEYKLNKLNSISFIWDVVEYTWNERYLELVQYQIKYGDCKVLKRYPVLGPWVQSQRLAHKERRLNKERIKKLEDLGFIWNM